MRRLAAALLAAVAVTVTACGSDDSPVIEAPATTEVPQRSGGY